MQGIRPEEEEATEEAEQAMIQAIKKHQQGRDESEHRRVTSKENPGFLKQTSEKEQRMMNLRSKLIADPETMNSELADIERETLVPYEILKDRQMIREQLEMMELKTFVSALQKELITERELRKEYQAEREESQLELHSLMKVRKEQVQSLVQLERTAHRLKKKIAQLRIELEETQQERDKIQTKFEYFRDECFLLSKEIRQRDEHTHSLQQRMKAITSIQSAKGRENLRKVIRKKVRHGVRWAMGKDDDSDSEYEIDVNGYCYECRGTQNCPNGFTVDIDRFPPFVCSTCEHERHEHLFIDGDDDSEEDDY